MLRRNNRKPRNITKEKSTMIKLVEILREINTVTTQHGGDSAGQLWPFARRADYARRWESSRMEELFGGSLEGMKRVDNNELAYIASINDIDETENYKPGGDSNDHWHINIPENVLGEWEIVKWMFDMENIDRIAVDDPTVENDQLSHSSELHREEDTE
jgi:hypothetical protein